MHKAKSSPPSLCHTPGHTVRRGGLKDEQLLGPLIRRRQRARSLASVDEGSSNGFFFTHVGRSNSIPGIVQRKERRISSTPHPLQKTRSAPASRCREGLHQADTPKDEFDMMGPVLRPRQRSRSVPVGMGLFDDSVLSGNGRAMGVVGRKQTRLEVTKELLEIPGALREPGACEVSNELFQENEVSRCCCILM